MERVACVDSSIDFVGAEGHYSCWVPVVADLPPEGCPYRHRHHRPYRLCH